MAEVKRLFLAVSFSGKVNYETGEVLPEHRAFVESVLESLRGIGQFTVFCAVEHEGWKIKNEPPEVGVKKDLTEIDASDVFVALVDESPSAGVQFETGYAVAKGKRTIIASDTATKLAYFNEGVTNLGLAEYVLFDHAQSLASSIKES